MKVGAGFFVGLGCSGSMANELRHHIIGLTGALAGNDYGELLELSATMILEKAGYLHPSPRPRYVVDRSIKNIIGELVRRQRVLVIRVNMPWEDVAELPMPGPVSYAFMKIAEEIRRSSPRLRKLLPLERLAHDIERVGSGLGVVFPGAGDTGP